MSRSMRELDQAGGHPPAAPVPRERRIDLFVLAGTLSMVAIGGWAVIEGLSLELFVFGAPAPGLFPFVFGVLLVAFAAVSLLVDIAGARLGWSVAADGHGDERAVNPAGFLRALAYLALGVCWAVAMQWAGFLPVTFLSLVFLMKVVEGVSWRRTVAVAVVASLGAEILFVRFLSVQLPRIPVGFF